MNEKEKLTLIGDLIENRFNVERFSEFIARVLNITVRDRKPSTAIWKEYRNYIESYQIFGDYVDKDGQKIYVVAVKTKDGKDPTRAKGKQREIVAKILREYRKDGALVAFYNENEPNWRMAFVKLEYAFTEKGIKENLTPAKRLSYVVGEGEASHTVKKQMMTLTKLETEISLNELEKLFQLEKVTSEFFDDYKKKYLDLKEYLETNSDFMLEAKRQNMENPESFSEGFAKKLMGQLAFLYFLQKKGWLGVKIVPAEIGNEDFNSVYDRAIGEEKDILAEAYSMTTEGNYRLNPKVMEMDIRDADNLATAFKNITKFEEPWGSGDKRFIRGLFTRHIEIKKKTGKDRTFFNDYLEYMFYDALNLDRGANQYFKRFNCKIPFLNGGLFEPYDDYNWKNTDFKIPDEIFSNSNEDGILDIFDRYNFTINENEPYETEVAVDPEMLGKVFENLLDVKDRKSKGAFYTPREIVHYMCKESITNYLLNEIDGLVKEDIEYLIQLGEFTKEYDEHLFELDYMKALENKTEIELVWGMPEFIRNNAKIIDDSLRDVRVADPAIGSGAFPLGMLNEIVKARNVLTQYIAIGEGLALKELSFDKYRVVRDKTYRARSLYKLKIETIENSLYGVDIEPSAVEIAKLRLWLSIVVDTQNNDIRPLPNLDFNFMVGNSLLEEFEGVKLFDEKLLKKNLKETYTEDKLFGGDFGFQKGLFGGIEDLKIDIMMKLDELHKKFFKEKNNEVKKNIKKQIEDAEWILIQETLSHSGNSDKIKELEKLRKQKRKPYFLWKLEFARVFQEKGGFDIVIGNPPYVGEGKMKEIFIPIQNSSFGEKYYIGKMDFWYFFTSLGIELLKKEGILSYIAPNNWMTTAGGKKMRNHIMKETEIKKYISFGDYMVFENASQQTMIFLLQKIQKEVKFKVEVSEMEYIKGNIIRLNDFLNKKKLENYKYYTAIVSKEDFKEGSNIQFLNNKIDKIIDKIKFNGEEKLLSTEMTNGIHPHHANVTKKMLELLERKHLVGEGIFILSSDEIQKLKLSENELTLLRPAYNSESTSKYYFDRNNYKNIIYTGSEFKNIILMDNYPILKNHLDKYKNVITSDNRPYGLHRARNEFFFKGEKIVSLRKAKIPTFTYIECDSYFTAEYYIIKTERINMKFLTGILNSKLIAFWLKNMGKMQGNIYQVDKEPLLTIPIAEANEIIKLKIIELVEEVVDLKRQNKDSYLIEEEIDEIIYKLYNLDSEEISFVKSF